MALGGGAINPFINGKLTDVYLASVYSSAPNALGTIYTYQGATFEFVYYQEAVLAGEPVRYDTILTRQVDRTVSTNSGGQGCAGMCVATITAAGWGWIQKTGGKTSVSPTMITDGNVVATAGIVATSAGAFTICGSLEEINCAFTTADDVSTGCDTYTLNCA
jgi:hypothetical protein